MMNNDKSIGEREYTLDLLKIIATFGIIFHHYQQVAEVTFQGGINFWGNASFNYGSLVEFFFVLSGYFMYPYIEKIRKGLKFKEFWKRRWIRLMPLVIIAAIMYEILIWLYVKYSNAPQSFFGMHQITATGLMLAVVGMQDGWGFLNYMINNPMWYVSVLLLCYAIFYFIIWLSIKLDVPFIYLCIAVSLIGSGALSYEISLPFLNISSERGYMAFFWGVVLAHFTNEFHNKISDIIAFLLVIITICWIIYLPNNLGNSLFLYTYAFYPSVVIVAKSNLFKMFFNKSIFGLLGAISYNTFVWHLSMIAIILGVVYRTNNECLLQKPLFMVSFSILCWLVGGASYYIFDVPTQKVIKNLSK